ncbi:MAG: hypothetical protein M1818_004317 [Claussenomyces sp. TS43310]|nr:MAG: hypothetical protein M1818_004317 [Claussenomyces sp. TS43310]
MSAPPFKVKAVYEYSSPHEDDLHFSNGQIITVTENDEEDWYTGEYVDASGVKQEGIFPRNFVEKYEPTAPPRPTRTARPKKEDSAHVAEASDVVAQPSMTVRPTPDERSVEAPQPPEVYNPVPQIQPSAPHVASQLAEPIPAAPVQSKPAPVKTNEHTTTSEKPSGGSFRDRIAAFNKPAAAPVTPFKPSSLGSGGSGFIKKPFVAPPPSKDAYVPPPREPAPQRVYRREEDPEIAAKETENQELAERAGLASKGIEGEDEDQPKPTSLKERIALLQKQQMEQAARHAEAVHKKEKPKRPSKKRTESHEQAAEQEEGEGTALERQGSQDTVGKRSMDSARDIPAPRAHATRQKPSNRASIIAEASRKSFGDGDGNDADMSGAGDTTEEPEEMSTGRDDSDERPHTKPPAPPARALTAPVQEPDVGDEEGAEEEEEELEPAQGEEEEEEEEIDPELRRREELRARMAKMSGGMGMHGMFGPPGGLSMAGPALPTKKKVPSGSSETNRSIDNEIEAATSPVARAPPVPMPGLYHVHSPEDVNRQVGIEEQYAPGSPIATITKGHPADEMRDVEDIKPSVPKRTSTERGAAPPGMVLFHYTYLEVPEVMSVPNYYGSSASNVSAGRPAPPPVPTESRPHISSSVNPISPSAGSESDDEMPTRDGHKLLSRTPTTELPSRPLPPHPQGAPAIPTRPAEDIISPRSPASKRVSYFGTPESFQTSPTTPGTSNKRASRMPPIPGTSPVLAPAQTRAPPPPPPTAAALSRVSTGDMHVLSGPTHTEQDESEEEVTEYEGDYDTDIASAEPHKDALKAHARDSSVEEENSLASPVLSPAATRPPPPPVVAPRAVPPPLPSQPPPNKRQSMDIHRAAPPPPPPAKEQPRYETDEYDPYNYTSPVQSPPARAVATPTAERTQEDDLYTTIAPRAQPPNPYERAPPPLPRESPPQSASKSASRRSQDIQRTQTSSRRSTDLGRMSMDTGFMAMDVDFAEGSRWWVQPNGIPSAFQGRIDILHETEETTSTKRGGKTIVTKDLYVLFPDYSQTIVTVRFDQQNPADASFEQRHEQPPPRPRQDQLEQAHERFGRKLSEAVSSKKDSVVGDGTSQGLVQELLKPFTEALLPVGTRAYGALVYSNLANASTQQFDEIRAGDIITLRNAKLQGKHGAMHAKYSMEVGAGPGHVGIVAEWDGTKKKVRAWEQGRESKKVKVESYKLDDLRSGEVKIWRIMPRSWVGWEGVN